MRAATFAGDLEDVFPLVPRHRPRGYELGAVRGAQRGLGSEVSGIRPYEPGDDVRKIDWAASAKLSAARGSVEFVVREFDADLAPRVVVVADRRPGMGGYPPPWLSKRHAVDRVERLIVTSAHRARALVGLVAVHADEVVWRAPLARPSDESAGRNDSRYPTNGEQLTRAMQVVLHERPVPAGSFVFVVSDFLAELPDAELVAALSRRVDIVPVVVQDPTWEASFPAEVGGLVLSLADPGTGLPLDVRLTRVEARERRAVQESRYATLFERLLGLGLDPIAVNDDAPDTVLGAFLSWADERLIRAGQAA